MRPLDYLGAAIAIILFALGAKLILMPESLVSPAAQASSPSVTVEEALERALSR